MGTEASPADLGGADGIHSPITKQERSKVCHELVIPALESLSDAPGGTPEHRKLLEGGKKTMNKTTNTSPRHHGARSRNCVASRDQALAKIKRQEQGNLLRVAMKEPATGRGSC